MFMPFTTDLLETTSRRGKVNATAVLEATDSSNMLKQKLVCERCFLILLGESQDSRFANLKASNLYRLKKRKIDYKLY